MGNGGKYFLTVLCAYYTFLNSDVGMNTHFKHKKDSFNAPFMNKFFS